MADYRDLLRRAVDALPENNGAARRQVYEKARKALVAQLRAINPPLPSREVTQHRLQLEDCIREVEHEATERLLKLSEYAEEVEDEGVFADELPEAGLVDELALEPQLDDADEEVELSTPPPVPPKAGKGKKPVANGHDVEETDDPIEQLIADSEDDLVAEPLDAEDFDAEEADEEPATTKPSTARNEPRLVDWGDEVPHRTAGTSVAAIESAAMSTVREVELEDIDDDDAVDAQTSIDRAIALLDQEARGEHEEPIEEELPPLPAKKKKTKQTQRPALTADSLFAEMESAQVDDLEEEGSGNALTIFLVVFIVLLVGVGGAGFWGWNAGYLDLGTMFSQEETEGAASQTADIGAGTSSGSSAATEASEVAGPGNTTATPDVVETPNAELGGNVTAPRIVGSDTPAATVSNNTSVSSAADSIEEKSEERLPSVDESTETTETAAVSEDVVAAGSQSLLLEQSERGTTGAVPFSGTVEWSRATDELGVPTIVAKASIPARSMTVNLLIRKNSDPGLPASHLMEIDFGVSETFDGGGIARLAGVLMKNEELVQGKPLVGASARVLSNSFLFALSASDEDASANEALLRERKWMDLALIYATGKYAVITLEKDAEAEALFDEVLDSWAAE